MAGKTGALMLSSIHIQAFVFSTRHSADRVHPSHARRLRPVGIVAIAILFFPLIAFLTGQPAPAQILQGQTLEAQASQAQASQAQTSQGRTSQAQTSHGRTYRASHRAGLSQQELVQKKHNEGALMMLGGYPGTSYFDLAHELAGAPIWSDDLRLIAVDARGGIESLRDLLLLRGIDLALVPKNVLDYADTTASFGPGLRERLTYVTELYGEEVHILAGPDVPSIENLSGKKVAVPLQDGNTEFTVRDLLHRLQIDAEVVKIAAADAIDEVQSGTLAALVLVAGKPLRSVAELPSDGSLHLLAVPLTPALEDRYLPGIFRADDYPGLIPANQTIDTVSVAVVLVANNSAKSEESNRRIARSVPAFFEALSEFSGSRRHPKWSEVNLAATLTGWQRFPAAKEWLDKALREQTASAQRDFEEFLRAKSSEGSLPRSPEQRRQLFGDYLRWTRSGTGSPN